MPGDPLTPTTSTISVSNLRAGSIVGGIRLQWDVSDPFSSTLPHLGLEAVEVWGSKDPHDFFFKQPAQYLGEGINDFLLLPVPRGEVWFFWLRPRALSGAYGPWFPGDLEVFQGWYGYEGGTGALTGSFRTSDATPLLVIDPFDHRLRAYDGAGNEVLGLGHTIQGESIVQARQAAGSVALAGSFSSAEAQAFYAGTDGTTATAALFYAAGSGRAVEAQSAGGGFAFFAIQGAYGPFTGAHDGILRKSTRARPGDVMVDVRVVSRRGVSDVLTEVTTSVKFNQPALGVLSSRLAIHEETTFASGAGDDPCDVIENYNHVIVNSLGEGLINVCGENGPIKAGDLLATSSVPGKARRQGDDVVRAYTIARAREDALLNTANDRAQIACIYLCG